jgi:hypothetical protein
LQPLAAKAVISRTLIHHLPAKTMKIGQQKGQLEAALFYRLRQLTS